MSALSGLVLAVAVAVLLSHTNCLVLLLIEVTVNGLSTPKVTRDI